MIKALCAADLRQLDDIVDKAIVAHTNKPLRLVQCPKCNGWSFTCTQILTCNKCKQEYQILKEGE